LDSSSNLIVSDVILEHFVDQISNEDDISDVGTHEIFNDLKATDTQYDLLEEVDTASSTGAPWIAAYTSNKAASSSTLTLTVPGARADGDLLLVLAGSDSNGNGEGFSFYVKITRYHN